MLYSTRAQLSSGTPAAATGQLTSFGRGATPPRRQTGLYELTREGIDIKKLISDSSPEENAFAGVVGLFVVGLTFVPTLTSAPVEAPLALLAGSLMTAWAVDTLLLDGIGSKALSMQLQDKRRVACHEAGHLLVGHLLGLQIESFTMPSAKNSLNGIPGGVEMSGGDNWSRAATGLAGIAAETVKYGTSLGGNEDFAEVGKGVGTMGLGAEGRRGVVRWGLLCGVRLVREHEEAHRKVCEVMLSGGSAEDCVRVLEDSVDREQLLRQ